MDECTRSELVYKPHSNPSDFYRGRRYSKTLTSANNI